MGLTVWLSRPATRALALFVLGVALVFVGLAQWSLPLACVVLGLALVVYGVAFVDVDGDGSKRRRGQS